MRDVTLLEEHDIATLDWLAEALSRQRAIERTELTQHDWRAGAIIRWRPKLRSKSKWKSDLDYKESEISNTIINSYNHYM